MATIFIVRNDGLAAERADTSQPDVEAFAPRRDRQEQLIRRLLVEGSDALALRLDRRLCLDRTRATAPCSVHTLTWADIAQWGFQEGLLDLEEKRLMEGITLTRQQRVLKGAA